MIKESERYYVKSTGLSSLILCLLSLGWFGGVGQLIIDSDENIIFKVFFFVGLLFLALIYFNWMREDE